MIHYDLKCRQGHAFDGWFRDSAAFERQSAEGLLACPVCSVTEVGRALMAPALAKPRRRRKAATPSEPASEPPPVAPAPEPATRAVAGMEGAPVPDQVRAMLQRLRAEVERNCDYVGPAFAEEARRIHRGEAGPRGIYGETTPEQAETLAEEGIEVARIPWVPRADG
ncbi:MAG: DUF1178 family protein [Acidisphaera sp.]|nr:DUF1178 family protein [Acidisphaera sp.]